MLPHDPKAIANEFIKRDGPHIDQMKIQKLVYTAHGWNLAINNSPLVVGRVEAWDSGPVMRTIWEHWKRYGLNTIEGLLGRTKNEPFVTELSSVENKIIFHVWRKYGYYTSLELSEMTHRNGTPWSNAYFGKGRNSEIAETDIKRYFVNLAIAGRKQIEHSVA